VLTPKPVEINELRAGEVGFIIANIKNVADTKIGDTITDDTNPAIEPLPGFEEIKPMVFAGLYTVDAHEHTQLREALEKLRLNDSSFFFEPESSVALGFGFRCGFLGLLHMEIIQERLEREFNLDLITTAPGVRYKITKTDGVMVEIDNPSRWLDPSEIAKVEEPVILATILTNEEYVGGILALVEEKRGKQKTFEYVSSSRVMLHYELPLNEIVLDFYDRAAERREFAEPNERIGLQPSLTAQFLHLWRAVNVVNSPVRSFQHHVAAPGSFLLDEAISRPRLQHRGKISAQLPNSQTPPHVNASFVREELPLRVRDAAVYLGVSPQTVYLWVERKQIPHLRVMGRNIRFLKSELEPFRAQFKQEIGNGKTE